MYYSSNEIHLLFIVLKYAGTGGIVIYLQQEGRGIGLANKIAAYALQDTGLDTVEANTHLGFEEELREYLAVPDILQDLDIKSIRLITNNPFKIEQLETLGVSIRDRIPLLIQANEFNEQYLRSKKEKMRHWLKDEMINLPIESAAVRTARRQASGDSSALQAPTIDQKIKQQAQQLQQQHYQQQQQQHTIQAKADQPHIEQPKQLQRRHPAQSKKSTKQSKGQFHAENVPSINGGATESETRAEEAKEKNSNMPTKAMLVAGGSTQVVGKAPANKSHDSIDARRAAAVQECGGYIFGRASVEAAIADVKAGKPVIVVDDADRENEGDLIMAAEMATAESIGYIIRYSSGVLCVALEGERLDKLKLPPMVANNEDPKGTAYSISVDHTGTSTGISAADRALTFRKLVDPTATAEEFQRPGHVFPLRYKEGGVRRRAGHTEASLDLSRLAGLHPGGVLAEVVHDDGSMQRLPDLERMAVDHNLVLTSVQDIIAYRVETEFQP